jgi:DNA-binding HxlR family transcriptional regulator
MENAKKSPIETAVEAIDGKWKVFILWHLQNGPMRNNELLRTIPGVSQKMLTQKLRELEVQKIVERTVYPEIPPRVEYSLTRFGQKLKPLLIMLEQWGEDYLAEVDKVRRAGRLLKWVFNFLHYYLVQKNKKKE